MPEAAKVLSVFGALVAPESGYGNLSPTFSTTNDGFLLALQTRTGIQASLSTPTFDGAPDLSPGGPTPDARFAPGALVHALTMPHRAKGSGVALTNLTPPTHHDLMLAAGYTAAFAGGTWTYTPTLGPTGYGSAAMRLYGAGETWDVIGVYANRKWSVQNQGPFLDEFDTIGLLLNTIADGATPAVTYPYASVAPTQALGLTCTIGSWTPKIRSITVNDNGSYEQARVDVANALGHLGFARAALAPTIELVVEAEALSTFNPYTAFRNATRSLITISAGVTGNRRVHTYRNCQLTTHPERVDNGTVLEWKLTFAPSPTTPGGNDAIVEAWS
jgi:hypothetical protein